MNVCTSNELLAILSSATTHAIDTVHMWLLLIIDIYLATRVKLALYVGNMLNSRLFYTGIKHTNTKNEGLSIKGTNNSL